MLEAFRKKTEIIADKYADLVDKRISSALREELVDGTVMSEVTEGIRMLGHITATMERLDRLGWNNSPSGQDGAER